MKLSDHGFVLGLKDLQMEKKDFKVDIMNNIRLEIIVSLNYLIKR